MIAKSTYKSFLKELSLKYGFLSVGFSKSDFLNEEAPRLESWLKNGSHGKMQYMENHFDKRLDPRLLVPGSKTVISFLYNYFPSEKQVDSSYNIATYAYGEDYHLVIKDKLNRFVEEVSTHIGTIEGRFFVDSAPVLEKAWAEKAGLGWQGKNANFIHPKMGSFFFLAEWICDLDIEPDGPIRDYCGTCTRCIDACPTNALIQPYQVDGSKCISYLTIELKDALIPNEFQSQMNDWIYGCDICQDVCPWNRFSSPHKEPRFLPNQQIMNFTKQDWKDLEKEQFNLIFKNSAVKRTKFTGLKRNIEFQAK
jgi:epoxyqueuosine reductase